MKRLLIIEDDADFSGIIEMTLSRRFILQVKKDGHYLIEVLDNLKPDVLLINNRVPQKTTKEIIAQMRFCKSYILIPLAYSPPIQR